MQVTDYLPLGWYSFEGYSVEWDGRGAFAGKESRERSAFLFIDQAGKFNQDYENGGMNYFKQPGTKWEQRMASGDLNWRGTPAKDLSMNDVSYWEGNVVHSRGWQYWENIGFELGIAEPFVTHTGVSLRFGFDLSEVFDWILGFADVDVIKHDDMTPEEFEEATMSCYMRNGYEYEDTRWGAADEDDDDDVQYRDDDDNDYNR